MGGDFEKIYYFLKEDFYRKGIKEWVEDLAANEKLAKKFEGIEDPKEILELAKKEGYEFTEDELMDLKMEAVSGGGDWSSFWTGLKDVAYDVMGRLEGKSSFERGMDKYMRHGKDFFNKWLR